MSAWEIECGEFESRRLQAMLAAGWEPFGVTGSKTIWLRRNRDAAQASAPEVDLPRPGRGPVSRAELVTRHREIVARQKRVGVTQV